MRLAAISLLLMCLVGCSDAPRGVYEFQVRGKPEGDLTTATCYVSFDNHIQIKGNNELVGIQVGGGVGIGDNPTASRMISVGEEIVIRRIR